MNSREVLFKWIFDKNLSGVIRELEKTAYEDILWTHVNRIEFKKYSCYDKTARSTYAWPWEFGIFDVWISIIRFMRVNILYCQGDLESMYCVFLLNW